MNSDNPVSFLGRIEQITHFTEEDLKGKNLSEGEEFWFKGANEKDIHGWAMKPKGWRANEVKKWPVILLIHGGSYRFNASYHTLLNLTRSPRSLGRSVVYEVEP